jgi:hypothetical protein
LYLLCLFVAESQVYKFADNVGLMSRGL